MAQSYIQLPTDAANTGKKLQTWDNTIALNDVYAEATVLVDSTGIEKGTPSNPVRIDPTGTTVQPVSGTVSVSDFPASQVVVGNLTNNNAAPAANNMGVLPARANAAAPTWTEGDQVLMSVDLSGVQRMNVAEWNGVIVASPPDSTGSPSVVASGPNNASAMVWTAANGGAGTVLSILSNSNHYATLEVGQLVTAALTSGTYSIQGSLDGTNWQPLVGYSYRAAAFQGGGTSASPTFIGFGAGPTYTVLSFQVAGFPWLRMIIGTAIGGTGTIVTTSFALLSDTQSQPILNPSVVYQAAVSTDIVSALGPLNTLTNSGAIATVQYVSPGTTSLTSDPGIGNSAQALRTPAIFKTVAFTTATSTAVWTPTSKKFRLMRFMIDLTSNASQTVGGVLSISLNDGGTAFGGGSNTTNNGIAFSVFVPTTTVTTGFGGYTTGWIDLGNGYLSTTAGNALNIAISTALVNGTVSISVCGTEE